MSEQQLAKRPQTSMERVRNAILTPEIKERFAEMMGADGIYFLNQVLVLVANSDDLQKCEPKSILISAMRAASLKLDLDPSLGQAWIIPYKGIATYQTGYRGIYELAMRTGLYRFIHTPAVYEGEQVSEDRMTGMHQIIGKRTGDKIIGWMLYFQLFSGFEKTFYMTIEEIEEHAKKYSTSYSNPKSKWHTERRAMERKTVLMNGLRKWGRFNRGDLETLRQIDEDQGWLERDDDGETPQPEPHTVEQNLHDLGYEADPETGEVKAEPPMPESPEESDNNTSPMTIEEASKITNSSGKKLLIDISTEQLNYMATNLSKKDSLTPAQETELLAIQIIVEARNNGQQEAAEQPRIF
jgi:recombination protein RecT